MKVAKEEDIVQVLVGRRKGQVGQVTAVRDGMVFVQLTTLQYELCYAVGDLDLKSRAEQVLPSGEARRRQMARLVREKKLCPSYPHACGGTCGVE